MDKKDGEKDMARAGRKAKKATEAANEEEYVCPFCLGKKKKTEYYQTSDTNIRTGITRICKECANRMALDDEGNVDKERMKMVLEYMDKPFLTKLYDSTFFEVTNQESDHFGANLFGIYLKNLNGLKQYKGLRWHDSDILIARDVQEADSENKIDMSKNEEIMEMYKQNRHDVIKILGYDPFMYDSDEDKPLLYSKMCGYFDETNDDEFLIASAVEIVKLQNQIEKVNAAITKYQKDPKSMTDNAAAIKTLMGIKKDASTTALSLAKDNGISQNFNKKRSKGSTTWSGRVKEIKELNLREQELNAFDVGTAEGFNQVALASTRAILAEIALDENDYTEMIATQREMITDLQGQLNAALEEARIFRRENNDLKDYMRSKGLVDENDQIIEDF